MTIEPEIETPETNEPANRENVTSETRRKLLRAGLAAAPVLMVVKSRSVLACGGSHGGGGIKQHISCSAFASLKAANERGIQLSHAHQTYTSCLSYEEWKNCDHPGKYSDKKNCYFLSNSRKKFRSSEKHPYWNCQSWGGDPQYPSYGFSLPDNNCNYAGFMRHFDKHRDRTLQEMLYCDTGNPKLDRLARHLVATILNKEAVNDDQRILPDHGTCQDIWKNRGSWNPTGKDLWSIDDTLDWFDTVYGTCV